VYLTYGSYSFLLVGLDVNDPFPPYVAQSGQQTVQSPSESITIMNVNGAVKVGPATVMYALFSYMLTSFNVTVHPWKLYTSPTFMIFSASAYGLPYMKYPPR